LYFNLFATFKESTDEIQLANMNTILDDNVIYSLLLDPPVMFPSLYE